MTREDEIAELRRQKGDLESLLKHPGWLRLLMAIEEQVRARRMMLFQNGIKDQDSAFRASNEQGEVSGLLIAKSLPEHILADVKADIHIWLTREREEHPPEEGNSYGQ